jgi:hypothetical protein
MAVITVYQAIDGKVFLNRNDALAYDAAILRRERLVAHFRTHKALLTDTGRLRDMVPLTEVVECLVNDALIVRTQVLV